MKAVQIAEFGPPESMRIVDLPTPSPGPHQVLVRVHAAGVGPWDAWVRSGMSAISQTLPLTPGSDIAGEIEAVDSAVTAFRVGDMIFGVTNPNFVGGYSEYALAEAAMIARKPRSLDYVAAASVPVVAVTALQMLFEYAKVSKGERVLVLGAAGNVGAYAVQLAKHAGLRVAGTCSVSDVEFVRSLGADVVIDRSKNVAEVVENVDAIIDTVAGIARDQAAAALKRGGMLVSSVSPVPREISERFGISAAFFLVQVTTERLERIGTMFDQQELKENVGTVLPLSEVIRAHQMLAGAPHQRGKIVLEL